MLTGLRYLKNLKMIRKILFFLLYKKSNKFEKNIRKYEDVLFDIVIDFDEYPKLQNEYLTLFKLFGTKKEYIAYLEDKVLLHYTNKQRYGTLHRLDKNSLNNYFYPIAGITEYGDINSSDLVALNQRRAKMNLNPLDNFITNEYISKGIFLKLEVRV